MIAFKLNASDLITQELPIQIDAFSFLSLQIWVQSPFNASGYFTVFGDESLHNDHFNARLTTGDTTQTYARTGYLGFLRRTESVQADGG